MWEKWRNNILFSLKQYAKKKYQIIYYCLHGSRWKIVNKQSIAIHVCYSNDLPKYMFTLSTYLLAPHNKLPRLIGHRFYKTEGSIDMITMHFVHFSWLYMYKRTFIKYDTFSLCGHIGSNQGPEPWPIGHEFHSLPRGLRGHYINAFIWKPMQWLCKVLD